jgi:serine/threonine protein kinase
MIVIKHESIINLYEIFECKKSIYLILEYCRGGTALDIVKEKKILHERSVRIFFTKLLQGVKYIHSCVNSSQTPQ